jgi:serine/threonine-protein kinase
MFVLGRLPDGALVARESGRFRPAREYPELHRFVSSPAMRWEDGWPRDTTERKPVDRVLLPQRLFRYAAMQETGALFFRDGTRRKKIYIVDGVPEYIASTDKNELLGEFLVKRGQVLRMEVDMALALLPRFKGSLGDALVGLSVLRPIELFRAVLEQTQMRYAEVLSWRRGEMGFVRGARSHEETFPFNVSPFELLARGVREGYSARELSAILSPMEEFLLEPVRYPEVRIDDFRLTDRDMRIIRSVTDSIRLDRFLTQQVATQKVSSEDVYFAVFFGLSCGFLVSHRWDCFTAESMGAIPGRPSG